MIARDAQRNQGRPGFGRRRESTRFPGLSMELNAPYLVFRHGKTCEVFHLAGGDAELVACSRASYLDLDLYEHVRDTAIAYAEALQARRYRRPARR